MHGADHDADVGCDARDAAGATLTGVGGNSRAVMTDSAFAPRRTPAALWHAAAVWLAASAWYGSYAAFGNITQDEGWLLECSQRVLAGQVPHRDFVSIYPAGRYYLFAAVLDLFDGNLLAVRAVWCLLRGAVVALVFALGRRIMPLPYALSATAFVLVLPGPWHKTFFPLVSLATLAALGSWLETRDRRWLVVAGLAAGCGAWFRHDVGLVALGVAGLLVIALRIGDREAWRPHGSLAADVVALAAPAAGVLLGGFAWIAAQAGGYEVLDQLVWRALREGGPAPAAAAAGVAWWLPRLALLLAIAVLVRTSAALVRGRWSEREALLWAVALVAVLTANQMFRIPVVVRGLQCGPVFYVLWFAAAAALASRAPRLAVPVAFGVPVAAAVWVLSGQSIGLPIEYSGSVAVRWQRTLPFVLPDGATIRVEPQWASQVGFVSRAVADLVPPGAPIAVLGRPAAGNYLAGRFNPTRLIRFDDEATTEAERGAALRVLVERRATLFADRRFLAQRGGWWAEALPQLYETRRERGPLLVLQPRARAADLSPGR
jgi:hypothetical protein